MLNATLIHDLILSSTPVREVLILAMNIIPLCSDTAASNCRTNKSLPIGKAQNVSTCPVRDTTGIVKEHYSN